MIDLKILQPDWLRRFWPISQEQTFSQIWNLCRNAANDIKFHYNSLKINAKFFNKFKKPCFLAHFGSIFPIFGEHFFLSGKSHCHAVLRMGF